MLTDCASTWQNCLRYIEQEVTVSNYKTWFEPIKAVKLEDSMLTLEVPSPYYVETLEGHYIKTISESLHKVIGPDARLQYTVPVVRDTRITEQGRLSSTSGNDAKLSGGFTQTPSDTINPFAIVGIKHHNIDPQLNEDFTFENFIEGQCNKLARSVACAVAEKPAQNAFNPFFVFGDCGVGKTHLIQAIGVDIKHREPARNVIYLSANRFMHQYMDATKNNQVNGFINFYQMIDVLIIDDIQEIAGKSGTENVFFQIFNHLQQNNKQIIIAADKRPAEIIGMEERLLSRFKSGMVAEIEPPDFQTRMKIIESKMRKDGIQMPEDVVVYIANNVTGNVREIEGSLISLLANAMVLHCDLTMELARKVVGNMVNTKDKEKEITMEHIVEVVCQHFGIETSAMQINTRKREIVVARQLAMYFCKELTQNSLSSIGKFLGGRNHSTVLYACRAVEDQSVTDKDFERLVKSVEVKIKSFS